MYGHCNVVLVSLSNYEDISHMPKWGEKYDQQLIVSQSPG